MTGSQTDVDLATIAHRLRGLDSFVICGHISPDGDCLGSQLALYHALRALGKQVTCLLVDADPIDKGLLFLPGIDSMVVAADFKGRADAFVACDVPIVERLGKAADIRTRCSFTFTLDHHASETRISDLNYVDPQAASCTMIVWDLIKALEVDISPDMALCAYTGLVTDTGGFQFQNTDSSAFSAASEMIGIGVEPSFVSKNVFQSRRLASLRLEGIMLDRISIARDHGYALSYLTRKDFENTGAVKADAEPLVNVIRSLEGIHVACILREGDGSIRGSLRAKDDTDVSAIARSLGGGGHKAAAGFTIHTPLDEALRLVRSELDASLRKTGAADSSGNGSSSNMPANSVSPWS